VLLEHNPDRPVGRIRRLFTLPWADGLRWHAGIVELDDDEWPRDQRVSVGYAPIRETTLLDGRRILELAFVDEISLVNRNAIPGARLLAPTTERTTPARQRIPSASATATPRTLIRRDCGQILQSDEHQARTQTQAPRSHHAGRLGTPHQQRRRQLEPLVRAGGLNCARCGRRIEAGQQWHLDHHDERNGYLGASHASCNASAGAHKANRNGLPVTHIWSRRWTDMAEPGTIIHLDDQTADYYDGDEWRALSARELAL
jgi:hypothetical protein